MTATPPNLSYLTIYNPTLRPTGPVQDDDDDVEEQAQILFYTSKERAVSRDRMLRQVGLAKALVSFSEMFNSEDACENIHSQTRRMIMVSPEPNFWIHAGVEVSRTPRTSQPSTTKSKGKGKEKEKPKMKEKEQQGVMYDYNDASVHDTVLRGDILRGYEKFKLTHGSFTTILSTLGQQALELQLERFFTVWAWSWNLEDGTEFGDHIGRMPIHPDHHSKTPILDKLTPEIPNTLIPVALTSTHVIPSARFDESNLPSSILPHLATFIRPPPKPEPIEEPSITKQESSEEPSDSSGKKSADIGEGPPPGHGSLMGLNLNMNVNMDMRKWSWPGYLTFGKNSKKSSSSSTPLSEKTTPPEPEAESGDKDQDKDNTKSGEGIETEAASVSEGSGPADAPIDQDALDDAMSSVTPRTEPEQPSFEESTKDPNDDGNRSITTSELDRDSSSQLSSMLGNVAQMPTDPSLIPPSPSPSPLPPPELSVATIHLPVSSGSIMTKRRRVLYMTEYPFMVALICLEDEDSTFDLSQLAARVSAVLRELGMPSHDSAASSSSDTIATATKILQPNDRHIVSLPHYTVPNSDKFPSKSTHLFNAKQMLDSKLDIQEVFTRGMSPQHWHVGRKLDSLGNGGSPNHAEVFMEVFRKEASLTDVDNVLAGVVRRVNA